MDVRVLVNPGEDPHTFEPTPKQMMVLADADLYFAMGFPFESQILRRVQGSNPKLSLIYTDEGVERRRLEGSGDEEGEPDPHIWLGPYQIRRQARNIYEGLLNAAPGNAKLFRKNLDLFLKDLEAVHESLKENLAPYKGRSFFVFHPAFGYFADTYGLVQVPIEVHGKSPTPKQIEAIIEDAKENDVRIIFLSPQFDRKSAQAIADALDGAVVFINPLEKDVLRNLEDIAARVESSLE